jgi:hypothetical protein
MTTLLDQTDRILSKVLSSSAHATDYTRHVDPAYSEAEAETRWRSLPALVTFRIWGDPDRDGEYEFKSLHVLDRQGRPMHKVDREELNDDDIETFWEIVK